MLIGYIICGIYLICTLLALLSGQGQQAGKAVMDGAQAAVDFAIKICGGICLWTAVMELMEEAGLSGALSRMLEPVLKRLFPHSAADKNILSALSENVSANILGLGNAATPAGLRAARGISALGDERKYRDELCLLVVINTASIQFLPTTIASVRAAAGASSPFDITAAVWLSSALALAAGLMAAAALKRIWR